MKRSLEKRIELANEIIANGNQMVLHSQEQLGAVVYQLQKIMNEIDAELSNYVFESDQNEIVFFKTHLTPILSECLYYKEALRLHIGISSYREGIKKYCHANVKRYLNFKEENIDRYAYFSGRQCSEDHVLFVRSRSERPIGFLEFSFLNIPNQTFARASFLAIEKLIPYLQEISQSDSAVQPFSKPISKPLLTWTGTEVVVVELLYFLKRGKLINNGNVEVSKLAEIFDMIFGTNVKDHLYRTFTDIKNRKQQEPTIVKLFREIYSSIIREAS